MKWDHRAGRGAALVILLSLPAAGIDAQNPPPAPPMPFEASGGTTTATYAETIAWLTELDAASPLITLTDFGRSPQNRRLPVVIADRQGLAEPGACRRGGGHAVLLVQACTHAGESSGKEAGMLLLKDLAGDPDLADRLLRRATLVFIPIFNVDGHERFGPYNRVNQNGPQQMGWRTTAQNLNLNRDFLKADAPEMRRWLELWNAWDPDFFIDIHSTDGADYQYAITYNLETHGNLEAGLTELVLAYEEQMHRTMAAGGYPMFPYVAFRDWHDPRSGLRAWAAGPRFSQGYAAVRNRPGLLIETHMLKDYPTRVEAAGMLVRQTLAWVNDHADRLRAAVQEADRRTAAPEFRDRPLALSFQATDHHHPVTFLGVAYQEQTSEITGGTWNCFSGDPDTMRLEFYDDLVPDRAVRLPAAYIVPPQWTEAIQRLQWHGAAVGILARETEIPVRTYRFSDPEWRQRPYEGRHTVDFQLSEQDETAAFPAGSVVVPVAQSAARAIAHLLEPLGPDSLARWGFFDAVFERVEYIESYVIEQMITGLLAENPAWAAELEAKKAEDPEWAAEPWNIRMWFYERTPYYDRQAGLYPIGMIDEQAVLADLPLK